MALSNFDRTIRFHRRNINNNIFWYLDRGQQMPRHTFYDDGIEIIIDDQDGRIIGFQETIRLMKEKGKNLLQFGPEGFEDRYQIVATELDHHYLIDFENDEEVLGEGSYADARKAFIIKPHNEEDGIIDLSQPSVLKQIILPDNINNQLTGLTLAVDALRSNLDINGKYNTVFQGDAFLQFQTFYTSPSLKTDPLHDLIGYDPKQTPQEFLTTYWVELNSKYFELSKNFENLKQTAIIEAQITNLFFSAEPPIPVKTKGSPVDNSLYCIQEEKPGETLTDADLSHLKFSDINYLALQAVNQLAAIHDKGVLHGDLNRNNCLVVVDAASDSESFTLEDKKKGGDNVGKVKETINPSDIKPSHELTHTHSHLQLNFIDFGWATERNPGQMDKQLPMRYMKMGSEGFKLHQKNFGAKDDINMMAKNILASLYQKFDKAFPNTLGIDFKQIIDKFLGEMQHRDYNQRPNITTCQQFFKSIYDASLKYERLQLLENESSKFSHRIKRFFGANAQQEKDIKKEINTLKEEMVIEKAKLTLCSNNLWKKTENTGNFDNFPKNTKLDEVLNALQKLRLLTPLAVDQVLAFFSKFRKESESPGDRSLMNIYSELLSLPKQLQQLENESTKFSHKAKKFFRSCLGLNDKLEKDIKKVKRKILATNTKVLLISYNLWKDPSIWQGQSGGAANFYDFASNSRVCKFLNILHKLKLINSDYVRTVISSFSKPSKNSNPKKDSKTENTEKKDSLQKDKKSITDPNLIKLYNLLMAKEKSQSNIENLLKQLGPSNNVSTSKGDDKKEKKKNITTYRVLSARPDSKAKKDNTSFVVDNKSLSSKGDESKVNIWPTIKRTNPTATKGDDKKEKKKNITTYRVFSARPDSKAKKDNTSFVVDNKSLSSKGDESKVNIWPTIKRTNPTATSLEHKKGENATRLGTSWP